MSTVMVAPEHLLFESWPTAVVVLAGSRVVFANSAAAILHVRSREELLSIDLSRAIPEWVVPAETAHLQDLDLARQAGRIEPGTFSVTLTAGDGSRKALQVRVAAGPRPGESTLLLLEVTEDVRELTDALAAASWSLVSKRDERAVLDAAADALSTLGFRVVILRDEGAYFRHVAIRQEHGAVARVETITGGSLAERPLPRAEAREFAECIEKRTAIFIQDAHALVDRFRAPDVAPAIKASMPRRSVVAPVVVDGEGWGVLTAQRDSLVVGEVGAIELFAHRVGSALEAVRHHQRAAERLRELEDLQQKLVAHARLAMLGETVAVLAHEIRNPVAAIVNALALLRRSPSTPIAPLRIAEEEALRLERLVKDLLHVARPLDARRDVFDLAELASWAVASLQARGDPPTATIELVAPIPVPAIGDTFLVGLALENLMANALRAAGLGRVRVTVEGRGHSAYLVVDDDGPGVPADLVERIFEPFFTTHASGTGLGLAIVRKVTDAHKGRVRAATSTLGGARFEVELPAAE